MNVLIVEDETLIAEFLSRVASELEVVNVVDYVCTYDQGYDHLMSGVYDLMLVDICLGSDEWDGLRLCEQARKHFPEMTIIILTSLHSLDCLEQAFALGVNDYMTKPFHPQELRLRITRWLGSTQQIGMPKLHYHGLSYDPKTHEFHYEDTLIELSPRNKDLLLVFLREPEHLLSPMSLREKFWGDLSDRPRNIRSSLQSLRSKLPQRCSSWIQTVHGEGYILRKM